MNCSECGSALLLDRTVFHCPCGAYLHAYCADRHILQAHRPAFVLGSVDLNGEFHPRNETKPVEQLQPFEQVEPSEEEQLMVAEDTLEASSDSESAPVETEDTDIEDASELSSDEGEEDDRLAD
ncbi:MAG: hypothetical protein JW846_02670 [Dehalococcoidia bacterium]|nr:hypothetical protein [Dehalococcoidia bacterium]